MPPFRTKSKKVELYDFQDSAYQKMWKALFEEYRRAILLIAKTGYGKTFMLGRLLEEMKRQGKLLSKFSPYGALYLTKATAVEKTTRDLKRFGLDFPDVFVTNYDQLRSKAGEQWLEEYTEIRFGEPVIKYRWHPNAVPGMVICDEAQSLKNPKSTQSTIVRALHKVQDIQIICASATPLSRVCESRYFVLLSHILKEYGFTSEDDEEKAFASFAYMVAGNTHPEEYSATAMKRLRTILSPNIVKVPNIKAKYKSFNTTQLVNFLSPADFQEYADAYEEYLEKLRSIDRDEPGGIAAIWVAQLKFRQKAELLRAPILARAMYESVKAGNAAIAACNFTATIAKAKEVLVRDYGVSSEAVSLIWGGIPSRDDKYDLDLGPQNRKERQRNIDRFQTGKALYCFFTFKAGGVALSLHDTDDHDGYAVENHRPREVYLAPTYSVFDLYQGLGRGHRINSLSNTNQCILFFRGTIEEEVAAKVALKLKSMNSFLNPNESWYDALNKGYSGISLDREILSEEQLEAMAEVDVGDDEDESEEPTQLNYSGEQLLLPEAV